MPEPWVGSSPSKKANPYRGRAGAAAYLRKARALKASPEGGVCWICRGEIDRSLPGSEVNSPEYFTVSHDPPLSRGGSLLEGLKPAHRGCNSSEGGRLAHPPQTNHGDFDPSLIEHSRDW